MKNQIKIAVLTALGALSTTQITGCASMSNGTAQTITISTNADRSFDTQCTASNEEGRWTETRDTPFQIHRDGNTLNIECHNDDQIGNTSIEPVFDTGYLLMDIILVDACTISCLIDGLTNAFYSYPDQIDVLMTDKSVK